MTGRQRKRRRSPVDFVTLYSALELVTASENLLQGSQLES